MSKIETYLLQDDMNAIKFYRMNSVPPDEKVMTDGELDYYSITLDGYLLMYARNKWRPDGQRMYIFSDEFAKYLGFCDYNVMRCMVHLQYWRGMITVKNLKRRFR